MCDDKEEIVEECTNGMGCGDGRCVDACTSAELSKGSIGCSFFTLPPEESQRGQGSCFTAMITNTWDRPVNITAELENQPLDISASTYTAVVVDRNVTYTPLAGALPPGEVAIVFLSQGSSAEASDSFTPCPPTVTPALREEPLRHGTTITRAFHLKTDAPVSAYSIFPYGGARSFIPAGTLLLPVSSWGTNYVAVTGGTFRMNGGGLHEYRISTTLQIVAEDDETEVRILPSADIDDGIDVPGTAQGYPRSWKLSRGQVLQFSQVRELTGSVVEANKRVGLFGGSECNNIPSTYLACDVLQQQIPALSQWGSEYALAPYPPRVPSAGGVEILERVPWRLVGAVDGTRLTYDPERPVGAPETLGAGESVTFLTDRIVSVKSQGANHPFYVGVYMTGSAFNGTIPTGGGGTSQTFTTGDPDYVNVVPSDQFLNRYVFFADHTFPETSLTIVRRRTANGFRPVELECAGEIEGFRSLGSSGEYELTWVRLTRGAAGVKFPKGACGYGRHEAKSEGPFSVTVWGTGDFASYGFAGGMGNRPLSPVTIPVPK
ncbi:MAG: IgGFc-binding protein [Labilithrix sp.]|nr:IgGFc-binding protein [Labilithrix sp.]